MIYWFTGQPGSGKTVLADLLKKYLENKTNDKDPNKRYKVFRIDGDEMRELFDNKDYSTKGRVANIDAAQKIAHYLNNQGKDVIVSLVSPYLDQREEFKKKLDWQIKEIYVHYDARNFRGREDYHVRGYQNPENYNSNFINIDTTNDTPEESLLKIIEQLKV